MKRQPPTQLLYFIVPLDTDPIIIWIDGGTLFNGYKVNSVLAQKVIVELPRGFRYDFVHPAAVPDEFVSLFFGS